MKLWILKAKEGAAAWDRWYDKAFGFIVAAETEDTARRLAAEKGGDENQ